MKEELIPHYEERLGELSDELRKTGSLGLVVIDASALEGIEFEYGTAAYEEVRQRVLRVLDEQKDKDFRVGDNLALWQRRDLCFVLSLDRKRRQGPALASADLRMLRKRVLASIAPGLARAAFPYLKSPPRVAVGFAMAIHNPLVHPARILDRACREALDQAAHYQRASVLEGLERLQDLLAGERIVTAYQPIVSLEERSVLGFEGLSRGAQGSGFETAGKLFSAATEHQLLTELDRLCRSRALLNSGRLPSNSKLFVNTLPATIRDPEFRGQPLIDFLDRAQVAPERLVIEITEGQVIDNYGLFQEEMAYFTDLGMAFAVDDVGAGYSGLEAIARLRPAFLKIDMGLVRDVHISLVNQEMVKAIVSLGHGIGAAVVAEGIQSEDELLAVAEAGADYGQGFYLGRPDAGSE